MQDNFSDWTIIIGSRRHDVHRVNLIASELKKGLLQFPSTGSIVSQTLLVVQQLKHHMRALGLETN